LRGYQVVFEGQRRAARDEGLESGGVLPILQAERTVRQHETPILIAPVAARADQVERNGEEPDVGPPEASRDILADPGAEIVDGKCRGGILRPEADHQLPRR